MPCTWLHNSGDQLQHHESPQWHIVDGLWMITATHDPDPCTKGMCYLNERKGDTHCEGNGGLGLTLSEAVAQSSQPCLTNIVFKVWAS